LTRRGEHGNCLRHARPGAPRTAPADNQSEDLVAKAELGTKRACPSCGARFYDLNKSPAECPECDTVFNPEEFVRGRRSKSAALADTEKTPTKAKKPAKAAAEDKDDKDLDEDLPDVDIEEIDDDEDSDDDGVIEDTSDLDDDDDVSDVIKPDDEDKD
jgi:uncharacterized protein (TIGR02300 family)